MLEIHKRLQSAANAANGRHIRLALCCLEVFWNASSASMMPRWIRYFGHSYFVSWSNVVREFLIMVPELIRDVLIMV